MGWRRSWKITIIKNVGRNWGTVRGQQHDARPLEPARARRRVTRDRYIRLLSKTRVLDNIRLPDKPHWRHDRKPE